MDQKLMDELVDRFLAWPLPDSVCADPSASMPGTLHRSGTNLLSGIEAQQMIEALMKGFFLTRMDLPPISASFPKRPSGLPRVPAPGMPSWKPKK